MLKLNDSLKQLYQDVRHLAHQLGSGVLERAGLVPVLEELCHNMEAGNRMEVSFSHFGMENRLGFTYEVNILRVIQELVSNVLKYANATQLIIQINLIDDVLNIMVEDNGIGFDQKAALQRSGAGLSNIEARLRGLNGTIQFENRPVGGTTVIINIPIPKPDLFYEQAH
jgi:signal transduction histidine kinase